jgi:16S rRNA (cytidine1402-2'-O)-methyltransferase
MSLPNSLTPGTLYVVATPIGNLGDLSPRAQAVLAGVDAICAEDTRTSAGLLAQFGISRPLLAVHDHNEGRIASLLVERLGQGQSLALISDAGTPLVSDPGYALVCAVRDAGREVIAVPGPCAAIAALSIAGLPTDEFTFAGFLPHKRGERIKRLQALAEQARSIVLYESPHRMADSAEDIAAVFGERRLCIAREITKRFEQSARMAASALPAWLAADSNRLRGEFVLVLEGCPEPDQSAAAAIDAKRLLTVLMTELSPSRAAKVAAEVLGQKRGPLYELAQQIKPDLLNET